LREDPNKPGLLFAGTERGVYVSFNDGDSWQKLKIYRLLLLEIYKFKKEKDLIVATHGRLWVLDDITPLYEIKTKPQRQTNTF
jgi:hypothetical protein